MNLLTFFVTFGETENAAITDFQHIPESVLLAHGEVIFG